MNIRLERAKREYVRGLKHYIETNPDNCLTAQYELRTADRLWERVRIEGVSVSDTWIGIGIAARLLGIPNTNESWRAYLSGAQPTRARTLI